MSRFLALAAAGMLVSFAPVAPAMAHDGLEHLCHDANNNPVNDINQCCYDPSTGGPTNVEGFPYCPAYLDRVAGGEQYATVDRTALAHTHVCPTGVNCGPPVELSNVKPFYGSTGSPAALPPQPPVQLATATEVVVPAVVPVAPTVVTTTAPAIAAPAVYSTVGSGFAAGIGGSALVFGGLAAAGLAALVAVASSDDDDDAATTTTNN